MNLSEAKVFRKSYQSFLRIDFSDKEGVNQKFLRPYDLSMPAKITIRNDGYKRFQNITVQTKVGFEIVRFDMHGTHHVTNAMAKFNLMRFSNVFGFRNYFSDIVPPSNKPIHSDMNLSRTYP